MPDWETCQIRRRSKNKSSEMNGKEDVRFGNENKFHVESWDFGFALLLEVPRRGGEDSVTRNFVSSYLLSKRVGRGEGIE